MALHMGELTPRKAYRHIKVTCSAVVGLEIEWQDQVLSWWIKLENDKAIFYKCLVSVQKGQVYAMGHGVPSDGIRAHLGLR